MSTFSDRLRSTRAMRNLTQRQVANLSNMAERVYQRYELKECEPTLHQLIALAAALDVSLDYLAGLTDDPTRH